MISTQLMNQYLSTIKLNSAGMKAVYYNLNIVSITFKLFEHVHVVYTHELRGIVCIARGTATNNLSTAQDG